MTLYFYLKKKELQKIEDDMKIEVKIEKRLGRIQLHGLQGNLMRASEKINDLIRNAIKKQHSEQERELISKMVSWCFIEVTDKGQEVEEYPPEINRTLEMAYRQQETNASFQDNHGNIYLVDLDSFEEYREDVPTDRVKVIRRNKMEGINIHFNSPSALYCLIAI